MKVQKSTRHSKITGDFSEYLILYWLSKYGFECARVDHTGIDLVARNPRTNELMGVSVKSRSRTERTIGGPLNIRANSFPKTAKACKAFNCIPYFAIVVDEGNKIYAFIMKMDVLKELATKAPTCAWKMKPANLEQYHNNPEIKMVEFEHKIIRWWNNRFAERLN